ncbi:hypothetical protein PPH41_39105 [Burkholderia gladioli]|nr:hypothetical protein [Burkholderia gladioli]
MKRTFLVRALLGAAVPMMMAEDVPAATQAAPEGGAPSGESASGATVPDGGQVLAGSSVSSPAGVQPGSGMPTAEGAGATDARGAPAAPGEVVPAAEAAGSGPGTPSVTNVRQANTSVSVDGSIPSTAGTSGSAVLPSADSQGAGGAAAGEPVFSADAGQILSGTSTSSIPNAESRLAGENQTDLGSSSGTTLSKESSSEATSLPSSTDASQTGSDVAPAVARPGEPAASQPGAAATVVASSGAAPASGTAAAPSESSGTSAIPSAAAASSTDSSSSATTTLSTAAAPDTSSTAAPPDPTTAALSSATADATLADAGGIPPTPAPALDPALGQIPPSAVEPPADQADAAASPLMFEIHSVTENVPPIRIYADGHVDGLPAGYQLVVNRGHAVAAELENLKADDRHLSLLASWHKEMEVLGRGLSGEVTRLLGETKKYLEDVL